LVLAPILMDFSTAHDYPAGLDSLWAAFGQPGYPRQKYLALGATAVRVERFAADSQTIEVDVERVVPLASTRVPAWARRLVGREQRLRQCTHWRRVSSRRIEARLEIVPIGLPVQAHGTGTIVELNAGASRMSLDWRVVSSLPIAGRRVERVFADLVRVALDEDHVFTVAFLQRALAAHGRGASRPSIT
jgi:hypothetical protein